MVKSEEFTTERNWNKLGLSESTSRKRSRLWNLNALFTELVPARSRASWTAPVRPELTDDEVLQMAEEEGHFDFLDDPAEDIYSWDDGEEL